MNPSRALGLSLIVGMALLSCPGVGNAQGTWSVIPLPRQPGQMVSPAAVAVDGAGNLYVADQGNGGEIEKQDALGNWSVILPRGALALTADGSGNLYAAIEGRLWQQDTQDHWSLLADNGDALGEVKTPTAIAVDGEGDLYVVERQFYQDFGAGWIGTNRVQKRNTQGHWSVLAAAGTDPGEVSGATGGAVDSAGNLYVMDDPDDGGRIQRWDAQGNGSVLATSLADPGGWPSLAVDRAGSLYVAYPDNSQIQKRDAQGSWSVLATAGSGPGQVEDPSALAVDAAGHLYVADSGNNRVLKYTPGP